MTTTNHDLSKLCKAALREAQQQQYGFSAGSVSPVELALFTAGVLAGLRKAELYATEETDGVPVDALTIAQRCYYEAARIEGGGR